MLMKARDTKPAAPTGVTPRVYSYTRFSSPEQGQGDSQRRQDADARAWADKHGLPLDESLRDEGLSGYHGHHRTRGALGRFLAKVEAGLVPPGSVLLVENLDRLGREDVLQALKTVTTILEHEIKIVTLRPYEEEYTRQSVASGKVYQLIGQMQNAHDESRKKSERVKAARESARKAAREEGRTLTKMLPAWLREQDGKRTAIPEAAKAIRMIFDLKLKGMGKCSIERTMNAKAPWVPPQRRGRGTAGWRASYIQKILGNPAVIGEYQPHVLEGGRGGKRVPVGEPIPNYFPRIIDPEVFHAVQAKLEANRGKGGRTGKARNLLVHLARCAYCGGPMAYVDKGPPSVYLVCDNGRRGVGCARHTMRYQECEDVLLNNCDRLKPEQVLPNPDEQAAKCQALRQRLAGIDGQLAEIEQHLANLTDQIASTKLQAVRDRYEAKMAELLERQTALEAGKVTAERELAEAETSGQSFAVWKRNLAALRRALAAEDVEVRIRLGAHLREFIEKIEVFAIGHRFVYEQTPEPPPSEAGKPRKRPRRDGEMFADYVDDVVAEYAPEFSKHPQFYEFLEHITKRRMSKEGRFLRVTYKTGATFDIVPEGSIASGLELRRGRGGGWRFVSPSIQRLWREFTASRGRKPAKGKLVSVQ
jgi:DNA invertase Pin-like site-specific DNA recombinase